jgi:periplasmic divalent cation tolerance protein
MFLMYTTLPDADTAEAIGTAMVEQGLAACANLLPGMISIYRWQGKTERAGETVLLLKTAEHRVEALRAAVVAEHPYECPCVIAWPIADGHPPYLDWVHQQVAPD